MIVITSLDINQSIELLGDCLRNFSDPLYNYFTYFVSKNDKSIKAIKSANPLVELYYLFIKDYLIFSTNLYNYEEYIYIFGSGYQYFKGNLIIDFLTNHFYTTLVRNKSPLNLTMVDLCPFIILLSRKDYLEEIIFDYINKNKYQGYIYKKDKIKNRLFSDESIFQRYFSYQLYRTLKNLGFNLALFNGYTKTDIYEFGEVYEDSIINQYRYTIKHPYKDEHINPDIFINSKDFKFLIELKVNIYSDRIAREQRRNYENITGYTCFLITDKNYKCFLKDLDHTNLKNLDSLRLKY